MPLVSFGDLAQTNLMRRSTTQAKTEIARLSQELTTGQAADKPRHLQGDLGPLLAIDTSLARLQGYSAVTRELGQFAGAMQTGLETISNLALEAGNGLIAASGTNAATHIGTAALAAESALRSVFSTLNTRFGDRSLFSGVATDQPAVADADSLLNSLQNVTQSATTAADVEAAMDSWFAAPVGFDTVTYRGGPASSEVPISAGEGVSLSVTASDPALRKTLKGLAMAALVARGAFSADADLRKGLVQRAGEVLLASETDRAHLAAGLGAAEARIEHAATRNAAEASTLQIARAEMLEVDPYAAATKLQNAETQLQMIYTLTARISRLNLADYL